MQEYKQYLKEKRLAVIILLAAILIVGLTVYFVKYYRAEEKLGKEEEKIATPGSETPEVELPFQSPQKPPELQPGPVGEPENLTKEEENKAWEEIKGGAVLPTSTPLSLPPVIFNTTGTIKEVKSDRIIVFGSGSNFVDQLPRDLNVVFSEDTITFSPGQTIQVQGLEGLKKLVPGLKISIEGQENIRGKTEFKARHINIF